MMKRSIISILGLTALAALAAIPALGQSDSTLKSAAGDLYVISAKAGGVNYVEGTATVLRMDGTSGRLVKGGDLDAGDVIETGFDSRAEILLNPGSFARIGRSSRLELTTTDLDDLKLKVLSGSAIFEVFASDDFKVTVVTPKSEFYLVKSGVYRVDVERDGIARLEVWRGKAETEDSDEALKKGRSATLDGGAVEIAKFDRGDKDEFEKWSKERAELIAKANKKLRSKILEPSLLNGFRSDQWNCWESVGLWVYSQRYRTYSFLPFGYGWRSPYGYGFRTSTGICYYPSYFYRRPYPGYVGGGARRPSTPTSDAPRSRGPRTNDKRAERVTTPPFQTMQRSGGVETRRIPMGRTSPNDFPTFPRAGSRPSSGNSDTSSTPTSSTPPKTEVSPKRRGN